jgi:peptidoglycan/LPS O-acetylase OafA/YrhL
MTSQDPGRADSLTIFGHMKSLDGIRGVAILMVMGSHLFPGDPGSVKILRIIEGVLAAGAKGVNVFFVLSGFLITGILVDTLGDSHFFLRFYARRCLRIFPLYYGTLLVLFLLTPVLHIHWHGELWSLAFYLQNTAIATPIYSFHAGPVELVHFWSLAVEEQFYFFWPLLVFWLRDLRKLLWCCLSISIVAMALRTLLFLENVPFMPIHVNTLCHADTLLAGGALAILLRTSTRERVLRGGRWLFFGSVAALVLHSLLGSAAAVLFPISTLSQAAFFTSLDILWALLSAGLIAWALSPSIAARFFEGKTVRFFGKYSYGLYVIHLIVFSASRTRLREWIAQMTTNKVIIVIGSGLLALGISILLAYASFNLYEKRFLRLKRFFHYDTRVFAAGPDGPEAADTESLVAI